MYPESLRSWLYIPQRVGDSQSGKYDDVSISGTGPGVQEQILFQGGQNLGLDKDPGQEWVK